jgi:hypothetical protein
VSEPTLDDAKALIERMKGIRGHCDSCSVVSYEYPLFRLESGSPPPILSPDEFHERLGELIQKHLGEGYEHASWRPALIKHCDECARQLSYPWWDRLDAEKVYAFMLTKHPYVFELSELESTL